MSLFVENLPLGLCVVCAIIVATAYRLKLLIIVTIFILLCLIFFYRLPIVSRNKFNNNLIYGPCYGTVTHIIPGAVSNYVTIFLNIFDVHHQYYPVSGILIDRVYDHTGKFALAYEFEKASHNEKAIHIIQLPSGEIIKLTQIAGALARRIVYDNTAIGEHVNVGEKLGMIHFGSRVDIEIPNNYILSIKEGDTINGLDTVIAIKQNDAQNAQNAQNVQESFSKKNE